MINERGEFVRERARESAIRSPEPPTRQSPFTSTPPRNARNGEHQKSGNSFTAIGVVFLIASALAVIFLAVPAPPRNGFVPSNEIRQDPPVSSWPIDSVSLDASNYISSIGAQVDGVTFFAAGESTLSKPDRQYSTTFQSDLGKLLWWELNLHHPLRSTREYFTVVVYLYNPDGTLRNRGQLVSSIEPSWTTSYHSSRWTDPISSWPSGAYRMTMFVDSVKIASASFVIEPPPATPNSPDAQQNVSHAGEDEHASNPPEGASEQSQLEFDCRTERRLESSVRGLLETEQYSRVLGSCAKLNSATTPLLPSPESLLPDQSARSTETPNGAPQQSPTPSGGVVQAKLIRRSRPEYPPLAKQGHIQGVVRVLGTIGVDGKLRNIRLVSGHPLLTGAAMSTLQTWLYSPALLNGSVVESDVEINLKFSLD